jgi:hypothetical protein
MDFKYDDFLKQYTAQDGSTVRRETGTETPNGNLLNGQWVYRGPDGSYIDYDRYRTDLESRYRIRLIGQE